MVCLWYLELIALVMQAGNGNSTRLRLYYKFPACITHAINSKYYNNLYYYIYKLLNIFPVIFSAHAVAIYFVFWTSKIIDRQVILKNENFCFCHLGNLHTLTICMYTAIDNKSLGI